MLHHIRVGAQLSLPPEKVPAVHPETERNFCRKRFEQIATKKTNGATQEPSMMMQMQPSADHRVRWLGELRVELVVVQMCVSLHKRYPLEIVGGVPRNVLKPIKKSRSALLV